MCSRSHTYLLTDRTTRDRMHDMREITRKSLDDLARLFGADSIDDVDIDDTNGLPRLSATYDGRPGYCITIPRGALEAEYGEPLPDGQMTAEIEDGYLIVSMIS
jgi:hypothetical protein